MSELMPSNVAIYLEHHPNAVQSIPKAMDMAEAADFRYREITGKNMALAAVQASIRDGTPSQELYQSAYDDAKRAVLERAFKNGDFRHIDTFDIEPEPHECMYEKEQNLGRYARWATFRVGREMIAYREIRDVVDSARRTGDEEILSRQPISQEERDHAMEEAAEAAGEHFDITMEWLADFLATSHL